jgi:hypothetical protein
MSPETSRKWLLLVHQLPARPAYQRVKLRRRLQSLGAVPLKKTVQALPASEDTLEDFQWLAKELRESGGDAFVCEARLIEGVTDAQLRALFDQTRDAEYRSVALEAATFSRRLAAKRGVTSTVIANARASVVRLRKRLGEIGAIDFFGANARDSAEVAIREVEDRVMRADKRKPQAEPAAPAARALKELRSKTWVTRQHVHVDRIACAWLVRQFIDPKARFRFVDAAAGYRPAANELRFDMADAEFTHRGDRCSFEVLLAEIGSRDPALRVIGEIIHDLDLKDGKFGRPEAEGVRQLIQGITLDTEDDQVRLTRGAALFNDLYRSLQRKPSGRNKRA